MKPQPIVTNSSIDRALGLLEILATKGTPLSVNDIVDIFSINRATAQTLVNSLESEQYIEKDIETGKYSLGYRMFSFGLMYRLKYPFLNVAEKHIDLAYEKRKSRINIIVLKKNAIALILLTKDDTLLPQMIHTQIVPAYASASGKILLAFTDEKIVTPMIDNIEFRKFTNNTIDTTEKLQKELKLVKNQGYATEMDELAFGRGCIAAPIYDRTGKVIASVSFSDISSKLNDDLEGYINDIKKLGSAISFDLGYSLL
jgi:DNA-binding IclR family transcriptional regulator